MLGFGVGGAVFDVESVEWGGAGLGYALDEAGGLVGGEVAPLTCGEVSELDVHDAYAFEADGGVAKVFAHASDLAVEALGEDDAEVVAVDLLDEATLGDCVEDGNSGAHFLDELAGDGFVDLDDVFLLVIVACTEDLVDDVAVVGEEDESFGGYVEAADWEYAPGVTDMLDDVVWNVGVGGSDDTYGFVVGEVNGVFLALDNFTCDGHYVAGGYFGSQLGGLTIDGDHAFFDEAVGFSAGIGAAFADVLV